MCAYDTKNSDRQIKISLREPVINFNARQISRCTVTLGLVAKVAVIVLCVSVCLSGTALYLLHTSFIH